MKISRRAFLLRGSAAGALAASCSPGVVGRGKGDALSFGIITDLHYADRDPWSDRWYRDSTRKLEACVTLMNRVRPAFLIELGDFIDKADKETETGYLRDIGQVFSTFRGRRFHVLGNHDVATFSKEEFLDLSGAGESCRAFDSEGYRCIVLDGNCHRDGSDYRAGNFDWRESYIPPSQMEWLAARLSEASGRPALIFVHQNLHDETRDEGVKNAREVRGILERAGNVRAVFQGHDHAGGFTVVNGIPYFTFRAAVTGSGLENNAFALVRLSAGKIVVQGYGKQKSYVV